MPPAREPVDPGFHCVLVPSECVHGKGRLPPIVFDGSHQRFMPVLLAHASMAHDRRDVVVAVREHIRTNPDLLTDGSLDWKASGVDLRLDVLDHDAAKPRGIENWRGR